MKKIINLIVLLIVMVLLLFMLTGCGNTEKNNTNDKIEESKNTNSNDEIVSITWEEAEANWKFEENEDYVWITHYIGNATEVVLPTEIEGKSIDYDERRLFQNCTNITSVRIPSGMLKKGKFNIGTQTFERCSSLQTVSFPEGEGTSIGDYAFSSCDSLINFNIPEGASRIGEHAFGSAEGLESVVIPSSVKTIGDSAFGFCNNLKNVEIQGGVEQIGKMAFYELESLTDIYIPESVKEIGEKVVNSEITTIHGKSGSYAETYAKENGINFVAE